ncbi:hypothetical protein [Streptomyces sp. NPDC058953]|uniref:hypothetical protein n=1 Tax=unclassified Streptomyces TaxID=2593676 RepID=UPI003677D590
MRRHLRATLPALLSAVLLGVWALMAVFTGGAPVSGAPVATGVAATPASPVRYEGPQRHSAARPDPRRTAMTAAVSVVAADTGERPAGPPFAATGPVLHAGILPPAGRECAGPRQERAPPCPAGDSPRTRAPPSLHGDQAVSST